MASPGSKRTDHLIKRDEYADAGIPNYWVIDIDERRALTAHHVAGEFGYVADEPVSGTFATDAPFPIQLDLDTLT
ncbi:Uma2 family endonuclease [Pseudonocardia sp. GCM10023141]|uniref:Uma2 family endonuclease n=1 Tax=Pseudonocardia sp. GCM10023141 TaxID=3252653 RepID=UPI00361AF06F